jgi:hypothetical protein
MRPDLFRTHVRLKSPKGRAGGGGVLHLALHFDSTGARLAPAAAGLAAAGAGAAVAVPGIQGPHLPGPYAARELREGSREDGAGWPEERVMSRGSQLAGGQDADSVYRGRSGISGRAGSGVCFKPVPHADRASVGVGSSTATAS